MDYKYITKNEIKTDNRIENLMPVTKSEHRAIHNNGKSIIRDDKGRIIIPSKKRVNGKQYSTYVSKKVPRDRTLTAVFDGYLDDILYPATIVGKRIRYPAGKTRTYKVFVDPLDKDTIQYKLPAMTACYRALTNRKLEIDF